jgi:precorrin-2/cobalt-factor-2 C20-methyltransferase
MTAQSNNENYGCLYGVGVGPGDPELLTVKAQRLLQRVGTICFTQLDDGRESYALSIVRNFLDEANPELLSITVPSDETPVSEQTWRDAAAQIGERLRRGQDVAFITEGDPMLYSEFSYLLEKIRSAHPDTRVEVIPGVSSVMAAAASAGVPLATHGQRLAILPAVYGIDDLREAITNYDTTVLMEVNRTLLEALANLEKLGLAGKAIYVRRATTEREEVVQDIHQLSEEDFDYFSLLIIKR